MMRKEVGAIATGSSLNRSQKKINKAGRVGGKVVLNDVVETKTEAGDGDCNCLPRWWQQEGSHFQ